MADYLPTTVGSLIQWADRWVSVLTANPADFALSAPAVADSAALVAAFKTSVAELNALKNQLKAAASKQRSAQAAMEKDLRAKGRYILASPNVDNAHRRLAGYKIRDTKPTDSIPIPVIGLAAFGGGDGVNHLRWDTNGNKPGTHYNIEAKIGDSQYWVMVGHTAAKRWKHKGQTPGVRIVYRICSQRGQLISTPSNLAIVYGP